MTISGRSPPQDLLPMELPLTPFAAGSHVRIFPTQDCAPGSKANAPVSGQNTRALLAKYDRDTCSWRTSQLCLDGELAEFSETFPRSGMMRNGIAYQLPLSALHTYETDCGWWPTPNKGNGFTPFSMLTMSRRENGETRPSGAVIGFDMKWDRRCLPYLINGWINPILPEWLMGFPIGHTDLPPLETP